MIHAIMRATVRGIQAKKWPTKEIVLNVSMFDVRVVAVSTRAVLLVSRAKDGCVEGKRLRMMRGPQLNPRLVNDRAPLIFSFPF